jgi:pimeloyl-ACP methyl ester carboxylesterase
MTTSRWRLLLASAGVAVVVVVLVLVVVVPGQLASAGAGGLLRPARRRVVGPPPTACQDATFAGDGVSLKGWQCRAASTRRGTLVYLHGVADNRTSGAGVVERFVKRGFDVVAYDSRAHGESGGDVCTYGFFEKRDLRRVLDTVGPGPIVLVGTSLGAAVALQEAALDPRVIAVVAAETFSDLRTVATEGRRSSLRLASSSGPSGWRKNRVAFRLTPSARWRRLRRSRARCCSFTEPLIRTLRLRIRNACSPRWRDPSA